MDHYLTGVDKLGLDAAAFVDTSLWAVIIPEPDVHPGKDALETVERKPELLLSGVMNFSVLLCLFTIQFNQH